MSTNITSKLNPEEIIKSFPAYKGPSVPGYIIDFLGVRTSISYVCSLAKRGRTVEDYPIPGNFHATAIEWAGVLQAVLRAEKKIVAVELGAGWGPWLVTVARAAQFKNIHQVHLVGVEACPTHCQYMASHFTDNGLDPGQHTLLNGVVGTADGQAEFPVVADPTAGYGVRAILADLPKPRGTKAGLANSLIHRLSRRLLQTFGRSGASFQNGFEAEAVPHSTTIAKCYSLATLLKPFPKVDLVHVDIQGDEFNVISSAREVLKKKVMRLVIGTHSRSIEQQLLDELSWNEWSLESEETCIFVQNCRRMLLLQDGCQVWLNPAFENVSTSSGCPTFIEEAQATVKSQVFPRS
jgi:hypothetical protein